LKLKTHNTIFETMSNYIKWDEQNIKDFSTNNIVQMYDAGYVFVRTGKGNMEQTRSLRINLEKFDLSSENRRVLRKVDKKQEVSIVSIDLPIPAKKYDWQIHKLGKDFYETKFGKNIFSASKIKELVTDFNKSNFNTLFNYKFQFDSEVQFLGYCICYENEEILHYCYPFYSLESKVENIGMGMMLKAILFAKEKEKKFIYLGSIKNSTDKYKLQFTGMEWFDGDKWSTDIEQLKQIVSN